MKPIELSTLIKPKTIAPFVFAAIGGHKAYKDYQSADPDKKKQTLIRDTVILTSSAAGYFASMALLKTIPNIAVVDNASKGITLCIKKIQKNKYIKEKISPLFEKIIKKQKKEQNDSVRTSGFMHTSLNYIEKAVKDCMSATFITFSAILTAFGGNALICKALIKKNKEAKDRIKKDGLVSAPKKNPHQAASQKTSYNYIHYINKEFSKDPANKVFASMSFLPVMRALDFPMTAVQGFDINREDEFDSKLKRTSYSLIANAFVPTFFISIATALSRQWKDYARYPFIAATTLLGMAVGIGAGKYAENKIENNLHLK